MLQYSLKIMEASDFFDFFDFFWGGGGGGGGINLKIFRSKNLNYQEKRVVDNLL